MHGHMCEESMHKGGGGRQGADLATRAKGLKILGELRCTAPPSPARHCLLLWLAHARRAGLGAQGHAFGVVNKRQAPT